MSEEKFISALRAIAEEMDVYKREAGIKSDEYSKKQGGAISASVKATEALIYSRISCAISKAIVESHKQE